MSTPYKTTTLETWIENTIIIVSELNNKLLSYLSFCLIINLTFYVILVVLGGLVVIIVASRVETRLRMMNFKGDKTP
jgi:hypothetical protein